MFHMKRHKQINHWIIKEKRLDEIPAHLPETQRFAVFSPYGIWQEDNLTEEQAIDFCKTNLDYAKKSNRGNLVQ